jgi:hypothetical protein
MTLKPYPSLTKLSGEAHKAGCVVSQEGDVTRIENGELTLLLKGDGSVVDTAGKTYTNEGAYEALGIKLQ